MMQSDPFSSSTEFRCFQCAFCNCVNEVPVFYFQHLDHMGRRMDFYERPELSLGSYEFSATLDYCKLILPETMKVFPVYMNSLMKTAPLVGSTELSTDDRSHQRLAVMAMGVEDTQLLLYPRLIPLHNMKLEGEAVPSPLRCSEDRLSDGGAFLLENGHALFLWLGQACPPKLIQGLFNLPSLAHLQPNTVSNARRLPSPSN
ncbi:unnamed protein product [Boreogadus saida]